MKIDRWQKSATHLLQSFAYGVKLFIHSVKYTPWDLYLDNVFEKGLQVECKFSSLQNEWKIQIEEKGNLFPLSLSGENMHNVIHSVLHISL